MLLTNEKRKTKYIEQSFETNRMRRDTKMENEIRKNLSRDQFNAELQTFFLFFSGRFHRFLPHHPSDHHLLSPIHDTMRYEAVI